MVAVKVGIELPFFFFFNVVYILNFIFIMYFKYYIFRWFTMMCCPYFM